MNWIKQNKFEAILLLVVIAAAIGIFLFGKSQRTAYEESLEEFGTADSEVTRLEGGAPYPNAKNVEERRAQVDKFRGEVGSLQKTLLAYRPKEFKKMSPAAFTSLLNETSGKLKSLYGEKIAFPEEWQAGFEAYTASPPKDQATAFLGYQLGAMEWIFTELAKTRPSALLNVHREQLPIERGQSMEPKAQGRNKPVSQPYYTLPVELTYRGREAGFRQFLAALTGSKEYFVVVRSMRVVNSNPKPPTEADVEFAKEAAPVGGGAFDAFSGFDFGDEGGAVEEAAVEAPAPAAEEAAESGQRILGQVLGGEELNVFLKLEILLFRDDVKLPGVGK